MLGSAEERGKETDVSFFLKRLIYVLFARSDESR